MIGHYLILLEGFQEKYAKAFAALNIAWFIAVGYDYAGFIDLPKIVFFTGNAAVIASVIYAVVWYGFAQPELERRKMAAMAVHSEGSDRG